MSDSVEREWVPFYLAGNRLYGTFSVPRSAEDEPLPEYVVVGDGKMVFGLLSDGASYLHIPAPVVNYIHRRQLHSPQRGPAMTLPLTQLPPVGTKVFVQTDCSSHGPSEYATGTVICHVGGWLAEVEIAGKPEPGLYAPEGMREAK